MAVSVVNGYICANSCDAAKAKKGEDPHPSNDPGSVDGSNNSPRVDNPAVVFGGSLSDTLQTYAVGATSGAQADDPAATRRTGLAVDLRMRARLTGDLTRQSIVLAGRWMRGSSMELSRGYATIATFLY